MNDCGWVIYHHPQTGRWHTLREAKALSEAGKILLVHDDPDASGLSS